MEITDALLETTKTLLNTVLTGDATAVENLIYKGADVNCSSYAHNTPLHLAALNGNASIVTILLRAKAIRHLTNSIGAHPIQQGYTPIHLAAFYGHAPVVKILLEAGVDVNLRSELGATPMHAAFLKGKIDVINLLVQNHGDMRTKDRFGNTPLHALVLSDTEESIKKQIIKQYYRLFEVNVKNSRGQSFLYHRIEKELNKILSDKTDSEEESEEEDIAEIDSEEEDIAEIESEEEEEEEDITEIESFESTLQISSAEDATFAPTLGAFIEISGSEDATFAPSDIDLPVLGAFIV